MHSYHYHEPEPPKWYHHVFNLLHRIPLSVVLWIILLGSIFTFIGCFRDPSYYEYNPNPIKVERELVSFANQSKVGGSFVLGFGSIEHRFIYAYMYKTKDGGIKQDYVYVDKATLYEDGDDRPYIKCVNDNRVGAITDNCTELRYSEVAIHIPKNSIVREFKVDINR